MTSYAIHDAIGGIFGILYAVGKPLPFPEAQPYKRSWTYSTFIFVSNILSKFKGKQTQRIEDSK
jgi:hypothetical protein